LNKPANWRSAILYVQEATTEKSKPELVLDDQVSTSQVASIGHSVSAVDTYADMFFSILDRIIALCVLIIALPIMVLLAIVIRLDSPGNALFTQKRIARARGGRGQEVGNDSVPTFTIYKFRTYHDSLSTLVPDRARFEFDPQKIDNVCLQLKDDPRITRVGKFLRRTSLDELPNFFNVLLGDMRIVGPRPEVIEMYRYYTDDQKCKFSVKPGITGLAQINGRGKLDFKQTVDYDISYVKNRSWRLDLRIILRTFRVVITGNGSY
jgi:lipopolysaccharide/colanic/teichoic acid biosynthesis glycosyltransferase